MLSLVENFGLDLKLLVSQIFNFVLILIVFTFFVYKPLLKLIKEREEKIKAGLEKEKESSRRLLEIQEVFKNKIKEAEQKSIEILENARSEALVVKSEILNEAKKTETNIRKKAEEEAQLIKNEALKEAEKEIIGLVKAILIKTVKTNPQVVDESLLKRLVEETKKL